MASSSANLSTPFSPRIYPRPQYPPGGRVLRKAIQVHLRDAILGVILVALLWKPFLWVRAAWPYGERWFYSLTINFTHSFCYDLFNGAVLGFAPMLARFKMSRKKSEEPVPQLYRQLITEAVVNHFVTSPIIGWGLHPLAVWMGLYWELPAVRFNASNASAGAPPSDCS